MKKLIGILLSVVLSISNLVFVSAPIASAATGCTTNGSYSESTNATTGLRVVKFEVGATKTSNASCTFVVPAGITSVRVMSVSGGGGGGWDGGGGGAGGGVNKYDHFGVTPGESITVIVGGGGTAATSSAAAGAGGNSSFKGNFASGGAGGGSKGVNGLTNGTGSAGGGGHKGTAGGTTTGGTANGGAANINFANNGGAGSADFGGGGGGAGGIGANPRYVLLFGNPNYFQAGDGGSGFFSSIEGAGTTYAGGGGGGTYTNATASSGGSGGGGAGGTSSANGEQGIDGLGGGGGGGGHTGLLRAPGRGGSGVVLVTYRVTDTCSTATSTSGNYTTVIFANTTSQISNCRTTWSTPSGITSAEVLIVAGGGGGGGMYVAGGGGAGGYFYNSSFSISGTLTIQVGGGGKGGETFSDKTTNIGNQGFNGGDSSIQVSSTTTTAVGGGGGGSFNVWYDGRSGGSGGGGAVGTSSPTVGVGGSATSGQGNAGGNGTWGGANPGGGGGGSASSGSAGSTTGGAGGAGTTNPITGVTVGGVSISTLAAGGGGGSDAASASSGGSSGVGGAGGAANNSGSAGRANTGSGGGGAGGGSASNSISGGNGSAGIVVIRYLNLPTVSSVTISGTSKVGQVLNSSATVTGGGTTTYQWQVADTVSGTYTNISGATSSSFTLTSAQVGKFIKVQITQTNASGNATATSSATSEIYLYDPPTLSSVSVSGSAFSGSVITATPSATGEGTITYSYQWYRIISGIGSSTINGATNSTYTLTDSDLLGYVYVSVIASNESSSSSAVIGSMPATPKIGVATPTISGVIQSGQLLTGSTTSTVPGDATVSYQWLRGDTAGGAFTSISGANTSTYLLTSSDVGKYIKFQITISNSTKGASNASISSATTAVADLFTITYNTQGGSSISSGSTTVGGSISDPGTPTRAGYSFNGWFAASSGGSVISFPYTHNQTSSFTLYAQWSADSLTITYNTQGGSSISNGSTTTGASISDPGTPTRAGYTFNGWFVASSGGSVISFPYTHNQTSSFTLYAQWSEISLAISYDSQGGSSISSGSTTVGGSISDPGTPTRAGYSFNGWFAASSGGSAITFPYTHNQTSNFTLYAQWSANTLTITYDTQGGSSISSGSTTTGGIVSNPGVPTRAGYTFDRWFTASSGGSPVSFPYTHNQTSSFTLYAQWSANSLTITYDTQGGSSISSGSTTTGSSISDPGTPTRAGYTFNGWFTASSGGSAITFPYTHNQTSDFTLYAQWSGNSLTITFNTQGGSSISSGSTATGSSISDPGTPTRAGYTFNGWFTASSGGAPIAFPYSHNQTSDFTLYAQWTLLASSPVISSQPSSTTKVAGNSATFSVSASVSDGGTLSYQWYVNNFAIDGATSATFTIASVVSGNAGNYKVEITNTLGGSQATITSNIATLTVTERTYTVTYTAPDKDGGSVPIDTAGPYALNTSITLAGNTGSLTKANYVFQGWRSTTDSTVRLANTSFTITEDVTFVAVWSQIYQLSFDANGGSGSMSSLDGPTVTIPASTFTRSGYTFSGWNSAANGSGFPITVGLTVPLTQNVTIYAQWSANTLTITFSTQGGSAISAGSTTTGGAISSSPGTPTRTGYAFNGWFTAATGGSAITFPHTHNQTSNFTLYAQWTLSSGSVISNFSLRPASSSTELIQSFSANTLTYSVYLENKISAVTASITRAANSSVSIQVRINDSGFRKLTFSNANIANSGSIPVPLATSTLVIRMFFVDRDYVDYTITLLRDQETKSATNNQETVTPLPNVVPADQVISSVKFLVNSTEVNVSPSFNVSVASYTVNFSVDQSAVILKATFTAPGVSLRVKTNNAPFRQVGVSGESSVLALNKGSNVVILRVISADGSLKDYNFTLTRANS